MKRLYFVRHGLSEMNVQGLFAGSIDTPLTDEGRRQASIAGKLAQDLQIDLIVSSPLSRAHETALIIAKEIGYPPEKIHVNSLFTERNFGELEGKAWQPDLNLDGVADIEALDTVLNRAEQAVAFLESRPEQTILVVSHGAFGRALRSLYMPEFPFANITAEAAGTSVNKNAEIVRLV